MAGKRSNGEGCIRKTKSGSWRGEIMDGYTPEGKRHIVRFTAKTRAGVLDKLRVWRAETESEASVGGKIRFSDWADTWYGDYRSEVQPSTYSGYRYTLKTLKKAFGDQPLAEILPIHINRFLDKLSADGYSLSMIRKCRAMLIQIFDAADSNGLVLRNPARKAKTVRSKQNGFRGEHKEKDAFTEREVTRLMGALPDDLLGNSIRTLLCSGMRVQELLALRPEDISEDGSVIRVEYAVKMVNGVAGTMAGVGREAESSMREKMREWMAGADFVGRDEFEAVKAMAAAARDENEILKSRIAALEAKVAGPAAGTKRSGKAKGAPEA